MKKSMMRKTTIREIKQSLGRYLAILAIVALGVGFFAGLRITKPAMVQTAQEFLDAHQFYDYRLVSTLGFEETDVDSVAELDGVAVAEGAMTKDFLSKDQDGVEKVFVALPVTNQVNTLEVSEGRLPQKSNECVVDTRYSGLSLGDTVEISEDNDDDTMDMFASDEYIVVGKAESPLYVNFERGTTSLLDGKVSAFIYFPQDAFSTDYFTDIYLTYDTEYAIYSDEYQNFVEDQETKVTELADTCLERRYDAIVKDAQAQIDDAKAEVADGQTEIDEGQAKIDDAKSQLVDAKIQLDDAKKQIEDGKKQIDEGRAQLADGKTQLTDGQSEIDTAKAQIDTAVAMGMLTEEQAAIQQQQLIMQQTVINTKWEQLAEQEAALNTAQNEIDKNEKKYEDSLATYNENMADLATEEEKLLDAQADINEANQKLADAEAEFDDKLDEMSDRKVYVLGRDTNIGYVSFENDSSIVEAIANVFPIFFFLVAALVCMTTMTRMIEEQRTQIGILKALGYGRFKIMNKYLFYSTSAAFLGSLIGFFGGCYLFPKVIWQAYGIMYDFSSKINYIFDPALAVALLLVAFLCTGGATYLSCYYELGSVPAALIRPKAPKEGKRILLERIPFIWNRLKFMQKVSFRNTFRYKKRFFMMLLGISGCTALLVTGFGINDSISDIVGLQYDQIEKYDASINLDANLTAREQEVLKQDTSDYLEDICYVDSADIDVIKGKVTKSVTMIVPEDTDHFQDFVNLHTAGGDAIVFPEENQVVLSDKTADKLNVAIGDTVTLQDSDFHQLEVKVGGISENYIYNYVYLSPDTYENFIGEAAEYKTAFVLYQEGGTDDTVSARLLEEEHVSSISGNSVMVERFGNMIQSLNAIVLLVIVCAAALAFIVLYNLTNINITERVREIATIKVLGFYQNEVSNYVLRENLVLTGFGAVIGLFLGKALHAFVILQIDINMVRFPILVKPVSYVLSLILTFVFAMAVNVFMGRKLKTIDMVESLKAIE